ncbi:hypothetical protein [Chryseobacterium turcicum]|uniref:Uncharacterized protein n=1 Tax=Chryseobacterium turcicum TaxID=2898076 RepID=A0A9Q3V7W2_9FLAO|nr:hypothetical protein [Chryseobacterium turcicum]MCD1118915.1 hypothetical protein [Chryseobacterium turcicum]
MFKYKILAVLIVIVYFVVPFFFSNGGVGADSLSYFGIAADLPNPETNLFPLGYPVLLRLIYNIAGDWFWTSRILNLFLIITILSFSYFKKFYFRETVLLFTGKTFFFVFLGAISEAPFVFFLYFLFYFLHQMFLEKSKSYQNAVCVSVVLVCMFLIRYSGIYIYASMLLFFLLMFFKLKKELYFKPFLLCLFLSGLGISSYLLFNYFQFGSFTGENLRGAPIENLPIYVVRDILGVVNSINPFIGIKPASNSGLSIGFQFLLLLIDLRLLFYFFKYYKKSKETELYYFHILLWIVAFGYATALFISSFYQQIEEMNVRMMAATNICLFFSFLILYFQNLKSDKLIWRVSCFFFVFLAVYNVKDPSNFLSNKKKIEPQMSRFVGKKYLYNDEKDKVTTTIYHIPIINKNFSYQHTNKQVGSIKENIIGCLNPKIKWLMNDTIKDKSKVLYTSEIKFKTE